MAVAVLERGIYYNYPQGIPRSVRDDNRENDSLRNGTLDQVITYLRDNWQEEKLPKNWEDLPGVGFMIGYQMGFLDSPKLKDLSLERKKELWISLTEYSLRSWVGEYLAQKAVLPGLMIIEFEDGKWKLKDPLHGAGFDLEETFSKRERNGVPYDTFINKIKPFFASAKDGASVVVQSPSGEGMPDEKGVKVKYPDSHKTYLIKQDKYIYTYTVCSDFDYSEEAELLKALHTKSGQEIPNVSKESLAEDFIAHPALFPKGFSASEFIEEIAKVREKKNTRHLYHNKTIDDALLDVKDWNGLWDYDSVTKEFINQWAYYCRNLKDWNYKNVKEALAATILRLSRYVLRKEEDKKIRKYNPDLPLNVIPFDPRLMDGYSFGGVLKKVTEIAGCAGGGKKSFASQIANAFNKIFSTSEINEEFCEDCGGKKDHYHCPDCSKTFPNETSSNPKDWQQNCSCGNIFNCSDEKAN